MQRNVFFIILFFLGLTVWGQTPGLIIKTATGSGAVVLDPNGDGYASEYSTGYVINDYDPDETEIDFVALIRPDPVGDPIIGPTGFYNEIVGDEATGENAIFTYLDANSNFLIRFRLDGYAPNSKTYSLFIDTDQKYGFTGADADPNAVLGNPGFEVEISLHTNFTVSVYKVDGTVSTTASSSYSFSTNCQQSIAKTQNSSDPDYFYDFFVPFSALTSLGLGITTSTAMRYVAVTTMNPNQGLGNNALSDVGGMGSCDGDLYSCFEDLIDSQTPTPPGQEVLDRSDCPEINTPLLTGATTVSGTSTEADGATIRIYVNGTYEADGAVSGGIWSVSVSSLVSGAVITATAQASGEGESDTYCNEETVGAECVTAPYGLSVVSGKKGITYSIVALDNTVVTLYNESGTAVSITGTYQNPQTFTTAGTYTTGRIAYQTGNSLSDGKYYLVASKTGACSSPKAWVCVGSSFSATAAPVVSSASTTTVSGTGVSGATLYLFTTGDVQIGTTTVGAGGTWSISSLSLEPCQEVYARQIATSSTLCISSNSNTATADDGDVCVKPTIDGADCISGATLTSVSGFSVEESGTVIGVYYSSGTLIGSTTVDATGSWVLSSVSIAAGSIIYATATDNTHCRGTSAHSESVTVTTQASNSGLSITTSTITEGVTTSISGTGTSGYTVYVLLDGVDVLATTTVSAGVWTATVSASSLTAGSTVTAVQKTTGYCESNPCTGVEVSCSAPSVSFSLASVQTGWCEQEYGKIRISSTATGVIYTPVYASDNSTAGYSILGSGGVDTVTTYGLTTDPTVFKIKATKIGGVYCSSISSSSVSINMYLNPTEKTLTSSGNTICAGNTVTITIANYDSGVTYELQDASSGNTISSTSSVSGSNLLLTTGALYSAVTIQVAASKEYPSVGLTCTTALSTTFSITVNGPQTDQPVYASSQIICTSGAVNISVGTYNDGYTYRIFRASDNTQIGSSYTGNGGIFTVSTGTVSSTQTYYATISDGGACGQIRLPDDVTVYVSNVNATAAITNALCYDSSDGAIDVSVTGNVYSPTYLWNTLNTTQDISGEPAGDYSVTITDGGYCSTVFNFTISEPDVLTIDDISTVQNDNGTPGGSGLVRITFSGGTASYIVSWTGAESATTNVGSSTVYDISNLTGGTYTITVADSHGCSDNGTAVVGDASSLIVNYTPTNVSCYGGSDGAIDLHVGGGSGNFSYLWSTGATTQDVEGLAAGSYDVTITDITTTHSESHSFTITQPAAALQASGTVTDVTCYGYANGSIVSSVSGGTESYTYLWNGPSGYGSTQANIGSLSPGNYTLTVTDANACTVQHSFAVSQPTPLSVSLSITNIDSCSKSNGAITTTVGGGTSPYTFDWSHITGTDNSQNVSGLSSQNYTLTVTDNKGCTTSAVAFVNQPVCASNNCTYVIGDNFETGGYTGKGGSTGSLGWSGNWTITNDATYVGVSTVTCPNSSYALRLGSLDASNVSFHPIITRQANLSVFISQATLSFTYCASNLQTNESISLIVSYNSDVIQSIPISVNGTSTNYSVNIASGYLTSGFTLKLELTTSNKSKASVNIDNVKITSTKPFAASASPTDVSCYGGSDGAVAVTVSTSSPGISSYSYHWSTSATTQNLSGLSAGTYSDTITDTGGCKLTLSSIIVAPSNALTATVSKSNPTCPSGTDGYISLVGSMYGNGTGYQYQFLNSSGTVLQSWSSSNTITGLGSGTYQAYMRNAGGSGTCPTLVSSSIVLVGTDNTNPIITCPANYTKSTNGGNCKATVSIAGPTTLSDNCGLNATTPLTWSITYNSVTATGSGNIGNYSFDTGISHIVYTAHDASGNTSTCSFSVNVNSNVDVSGLSVLSSDVCLGSSETTYLIGNLADGSYTVAYTLSGVNSGSYTASLTIAGGTGDGSFSVSSANLATAGATTIAITSITSTTTTCVSYVDISDSFSVYTIPSAPTGSASQAFCSEDSPVVNDLSISTASSAIIHWYTTSAGYVSVAGTDLLVNGTTYYASQEVNSCESSSRLAVTAVVHTSPASASLDGSTSICNGGTTDISATIAGGTGPYVLVYNNGSSNVTVNNYTSGAGISVSPATTTTYSLVSVTDSYGCTASSLSGSATITVNSNPSGALLSGAASICEGASTNLTFTATGGASPYDIVYSDGSSNYNVDDIASGGTISVGPTTTTSYYLVSVTDNNGCLATSLTGSPVVTIYDGATSAVLTTTDSHICNGNTSSLKVVVTGGVSPYTVVYSDGTSNSTVNNYTSGGDISVSPASTTTYSLVSVADAHGCASSSVSGTPTVNVHYGSSSAVMSGTTTICIGSLTNIFVTVTGGTSPYTLVYSNGSDNTTVSGYLSGDIITVGPVVNTTYTIVSLTDAYGCTGSGNSGNAVITVSGIPSITLTGAESVCETIVSADLYYSATTGSPNQYAIDWDEIAEGAGFTDVGYTNLSSSPISVDVPGSVPGGSYTGVLYVKNTTSGCEGGGATFVVEVEAVVHTPQLIKN